MYMLSLLRKNICLNKDTGFYEAAEAASKYSIDPSLIENLSAYLNNNPQLLIAHWYRNLSDTDRGKVQKSFLYS